MFLEWLLVVFSLLLLFVGGEGLVKGASSLAQRAGLTPLMIGLTVVAFGTSSPELVVSIKASISLQGDIATGNVVGSNIFNIGVILGITALICPIAVKSQIVKFDAPVMIIVASAFPFIMWNGHIGRLEGLVLCIAIFLYTLWNFIMAKKSGDPDELAEFEEEVPRMLKNVFWDLAYIAGGLLFLLIGSRLLVDNSVQIARALGISEAVIGITIVAAGTSMPELVTCVVAAVRRHPDIAIGNVVGSNIFNILGVLGGAALAHPIISNGISQVDIYVMIAFSVLLLPMLWTDFKLRRIEGVVLLVAYCAYLAWLWPK